MELKVWVEGVVRVVSGLSLNTSCQDVVIALAQSIGQTGRYVLILKLRGNERHLVADDRPLQLLAQLGQLAADVQFVLRRTGPLLGGSQESVVECTNARNHLPPIRPAEPEPIRRSEPQKAFTFSLGPSTVPKRTKANTTWSPSPPASPRASPVAELHQASREEAFRNILQQQRRLQDLEKQLEALEKQTEFWERKVASSAVPGLNPTEERDRLELRFRSNEAELLCSEHWQRDLREEMDREQDMQTRLDQIRSSIEDQSDQVARLQSRSAHLEQDIRTRIQKQIAEVTGQHADQTLDPLRLELLSRLQLGEELDSALRETQRDLDSAEERVKDRSETIQELNKELRHCHLQHFIQQTGRTSPTEQTPPPGDHIYIRNAGILN